MGTTTLGKVCRGTRGVGATNMRFFFLLLLLLEVRVISAAPTAIPTAEPTRIPTTLQPTVRPTPFPSLEPTANPTQPTPTPTTLPTLDPTFIPTAKPSALPTTFAPTVKPTFFPTVEPTVLPTPLPTGKPSAKPSPVPSAKPTFLPSAIPTVHPTASPTPVPTPVPSAVPTFRPTGQPTRSPTGQPSQQPTARPSGQPSRQPTGQPTRQPTQQPSRRPSRQPTSQPTRQPTCAPTSPTGQPTRKPTRQPTGQPTSQPTGQPSRRPTGQPSRQPSSRPTAQPTRQPTGKPTSNPTRQPSSRPTRQPTGQPSRRPTQQPTGKPSQQPSSQPTGQPTFQPTSPTGQPSRQPTSQPSRIPSGQPTRQPSRRPTGRPTHRPTGQPSSQPTCQPSVQPTNPTGQPSSAPTNPTGEPTMQPTGQPSRIPSSQPSSLPTVQPTGQPSGGPTCRPSGQPTMVPTNSLSTLVSFSVTIKLSNYGARQNELMMRHNKFNLVNLGRKKPFVFEAAVNDALGGFVDLASARYGTFKFIDTQPTGQPTRQPSSRPSRIPTSQPSREPTSNPTPTSSPRRKLRLQINATEYSRRLISENQAGPQQTNRKLQQISEDIVFSQMVDVQAERYYSRGQSYPSNVVALAYQKALDTITSSLSSGTFIGYVITNAVAINATDTQFLGYLNNLVVSTDCSDKTICTTCSYGMCSDGVYTIKITHSAKPTGSPTSEPTSIQCGSGYYHDSHHPICHICTAGKFSGLDAFACNNCSAGTTSLETSSFCTDCNVGYYAHTSGSPQCTKCVWPSNTLKKRSSSCDYTCYCLNPANLSLATNTMLLMYVVVMLYSGFSREDQKTAEDKMGYSFRMFVFTVLPLLDFVTDFIYILSSNYAHKALLAMSIIFTLMPTFYFMRKLYFMGALMPRLIVPLPFFVTNSRYLWWLRFEKGFPRFVNAWDPPKGVLKKRLKEAIEKKRKQKVIDALEKKLNLYGPNGELPWHKFDASFDKHDSLPKLFSFWLLWGLILGFQCLYIMLWLFVVVPILLLNSPLLISWVILGAYLYQTKCLAIASSWNIWIRVWYGHSKKKPCPFLTEEGKAPNYDPAIDTVLMNESFYAGFLYEAVPQLIIQTINNFYTGEWTAFAVFSLSTSCYMVCIGTFRYFTYTRAVYNINGEQVHILSHTDLRTVPLSYSVPAIRPKSSDTKKVELYWTDYKIEAGSFSDRFVKQFASQKPWKEILKEQWEDAKKRMLPQHKEEPGVRVMLSKKKDGRSIEFDLMTFDRKKLGLPSKTKKDEVSISIEDLLPWTEKEDDTSTWVKKTGKKQAKERDPQKGSDEESDAELDLDVDIDHSSEEEKDEKPKIDPLKLLRTVMDAGFEHAHSDEDSYDEYSDIDPEDREIYLKDSDDELDILQKEELFKKRGWGFQSFFLGGLSASRDRSDSLGDNDDGVTPAEGDDPALTSAPPVQSRFRLFTNFRSSQQTNISDVGDSNAKSARGLSKVSEEKEIDLFDEFEFDFDSEIKMLEEEKSKLAMEMNRRKKEIRWRAPQFFPPRGGTVSRDAIKEAERKIREDKKTDEERMLEKKRQIALLSKQRMFERKLRTLELVQEQHYAVKVPDILKKETHSTLRASIKVDKNMVQIKETDVDRLHSVDVGSSVTGDGIPTDTLIVGKDKSSITLSNSPTKSRNNVQLEIMHRRNIDALSPKSKVEKAKERKGVKKWWHSTKQGAKKAIKRAKSGLDTNFRSMSNLDDSDDGDADAEDEHSHNIKPLNLGKKFDTAASDEADDDSSPMTISSLLSFTSSSKSPTKKSATTMIVGHDGESHEEGAFFRDA